MPTATMPATSSQPKRKPVKSFTLGAVRASIWENVSEDGTIRHNATFKRSYRSNGQWVDTSSLGVGDLLLNRKLIDLTVEWMLGSERQVSAPVSAPGGSYQGYSRGE